MTAANEHPEAPTIRFSGSAEFVIRTQSAELSWEVEHAETVTIEPGIGTVAAKGTYPVHPNESTVYTLTATGPAGTKSETVTLNVFPTPLLPHLLVPTSPEIRQKALFTGIREQLPEAPRLSPIRKFTVETPAIHQLNGKLIPPAVTVNDLSDALNIPKSELYASIGYSGKRLRTALFNRLERLFSRNTKHHNIIKRLRRDYE